MEGKKGALKRNKIFVVFILSNDFELHASLVTPLWAFLGQSRVPLYEKYITVIYALGSAHYKSTV